jgi:hypothetical protein
MSALPSLTIEQLKAETGVFAQCESAHNEPSIFGTTDGKAIGPLEHKFQGYLAAKYAHPRFGQVQIEHYITGITDQLYLYKSDVRKIFVSVISFKQQQQLKSLATQFARLRDIALALLTAACRAVELTIEQSAPVAFAG